MKLSGLAMIAVAAGSLFAAAPAAAQKQVEVHRTVTTTRVDNRGWNDNRRVNKKRSYHRQKVCRKRWVNHRRVTRCTWVRR